MGWSNGMGLLAEIWEVIEPHLDKNEEVRVSVCEQLIESFEEFDADDTSYLNEFPEMVKALKNIHPDWDWKGIEEDIDD